MTPPNPYKNPSDGLWYWLDETGAPSEEGYPAMWQALRELAAYVEWLNTGRLPWDAWARWRWRQFKRLWIEFLKA